METEVDLAELEADSLLILKLWAKNLSSKTPTAEPKSKFN